MTASDEPEPLRIETVGGVVSLVLDRPGRLHALDARLADRLTAAIDAAASDRAVRVLVLRGGHGAFCAGGDVQDMATGGARGADAALLGMERWRRLSRALHGIDKPVIAAADGVAYGAGMSLLLLSDVVLLSDRARLCLAFQRIGLVPDCGALHLLPRIVGLQRAKELCFSAREIGAEEAKSLGLAMEVHAPEALEARAASLAREWASSPSLSLALTKRALRASTTAGFEAALDLEAAHQAVALSSEDHRQALARFTSRRSG